MNSRQPITPWAPAVFASALALTLWPAAAQHQHHEGHDTGAAPGIDHSGHGLSVAAEQPGVWLGVSVAPLDDSLRSHLPSVPPGTGLLVTEVAPESPASTAALQRHDVLVRWDDQMLVSLEQLQILVGARQPGESGTLTLVRAGQEMQQQVTLEERPHHLHLELELPPPPVQPPPAPPQPQAQPQPQGPHGFPPPGLGPQIPEEIRRWSERFLHENLFKPGTADLENWAERFRKALEEHLKGWDLNPHEHGEPPAAEDLPDQHHDHPPAAEQPPPEAGPAEAPAPDVAASSVSKIVVSDEKGTTELTVTDGKKHVVFKDNDGNVLFEGPCTTDEERNAIPAELRAKLDQLSLRVHPPEHGGLPGAPSGAAPEIELHNFDGFFKQLGEGVPEEFGRRLRGFLDRQGESGAPRID